MRNKFSAFSFKYLRLVITTIIFLQPLSVLASDEKQLNFCKSEKTLNQVLELAFDQSIILSEIEKNFANQIATALSVGLKENPELSLEQTRTNMNLNGDNDDQKEISINQPLRLSDFGAREKAQFIMLSVGEVDKQAQLLELDRKIALQFYTLAALQETEKILNEAETFSLTKVQTIRNGLKKGLFTMGDEMLFEGEQFRLQAQKQGNQAASFAMQSELGRSLGLKCLIKTKNNKIFKELPSEIALIKKAHASKVSQQTRIDLLSKLAKEQSRIAELDSYIKFTPRLVYQHTNDGGDFLGLGISIPLPLWNRNQGEIMRADAEVKSAKHKQDYYNSGGFEIQIKIMRAAAFAAQEQAKTFYSKVIPSFKAALTAQEKLYQRGSGNPIQVWQTFRILNDAQSQALELWLNATLLRSQLSIFIGEIV